MRRWFVIFGVVVAILGIAGVLTLRWARRRLPDYVRDRAVSTLREHFDSEVEFKNFQVSVSPGITLSGENLVLRHKGRSDVPPLIYVRQFSTSASLIELLRTPSHVGLVRLDGLHITVPPRGGASSTPSPHPRERPPFKVTVGEIVADNAQLDMLSSQPDKPPRTFLIHELTLHNAGLGEPMSFRATLTNPTPRGEIETRGQFGPWQREVPSLTPVAGTYTFTHADLATFRGLGGILSSHGRFSGLLNRIDVRGETSTPDFKLSISGHPVPLETEFHAVVDGTTGNTLLDPVRARLINSWIVAKGGVFRVTGEKHRIVLLDVTADGARLDDLLRVAVKEPKLPMSGVASFKAKLAIPPGEGDIAERLKLDGQFNIGQARFTTLNVQEKVDALSRRGRGQPRNAEVENVASDLRGQFSLRHGVMSFPQLEFNVVGASVGLHGTYAVQDEQLDFRGVLRLRAKISQTTTGIKSLLLKPVDPLFERRGAGTSLPIKVTGYSTHPSFGVELGRVFRR